MLSAGRRQVSLLLLHGSGSIYP
ncbi:hypothetical protein GQ600_9395 [Phytophthora cactorum]|nr:hypothetical protein GQ600_9395 [Phytophthora cactorum]